MGSRGIKNQQESAEMFHKMRGNFFFLLFVWQVLTTEALPQLLSNSQKTVLPSLTWHVAIVRRPDFIAQWEVVSQMTIKKASLNQLPVFSLQLSLIVNSNIMPTTICYTYAESNLHCCLLDLLCWQDVHEMPSVLQSRQL